MNGRKRHILVDSLGLLLVVLVHSAAIQDAVGGQAVLRAAWARWFRLLWIWADGGYGVYGNRLRDWLARSCGWGLGIVKRNEDVPGWQLLAHRWIVERTFAWLDRCRRLSKDYEFYPETSEAWVHLSMIHLMVRRLTGHRLS